MRNIIIIYNCSAGKGKNSITKRKIIKYLKANTQNIKELIEFETKNSTDIYEFLAKIKYEQGQPLTIVVIGGDGTLSTTINAVCNLNIKCNMAIYKGGTANDFATAIKSPKNIRKFCEMIINGNVQKIDLAKANDKYVINAVGGGNFTHGSTYYNQKNKKYLGKFGYYVNCFFKAFKLKSKKLKIIINNNEINDNFYFYYIINSKVAGGFKNYAPTANLYDGKFVFIGIKKCGFFRFCLLFLKILAGKHLTDKYIYTCKGTEFVVELLNTEDNTTTEDHCKHIVDKKPITKQVNRDISDIETKIFEYSDIDGNIGPKHPLKIKVLNQYLSFYTSIKTPTNE